MAIEDAGVDGRTWNKDEQFEAGVKFICEYDGIVRI